MYGATLRKGVNSNIILILNLNPISLSFYESWLLTKFIFKVISKCSFFWYFYFQVKLLLEMLVKKCGMDAVKAVMPEEHMKLLTNIRKVCQIVLG